MLKPFKRVLLMYKKFGRKLHFLKRVIQILGLRISICTSSLCIFSVIFSPFHVNMNNSEHLNEYVSVVLLKPSTEYNN